MVKASDPETKTVSGYRGRYVVDSNGDVRTTNYRRTGTTRCLTKWVTTDGYYSVSFCIDGKTHHKRVHRLVAEAFIPNPNNKPHVNHINSNRFDNRADNLEWVTPAENVAHTKKLGRTKRGNEHAGCKLRDEEVSKVFTLRRQGWTQARIASHLNVSSTLVWKILNGVVRKNHHRSLEEMEQ